MQLPEGWHISSLNSILRKTETIDPTKNPEKEFNYIDVSSVSNTFFKITETQKIIGKDAPSRARRLVKKNDVIFATIRPTLKRIAIISDEFDNYICSTGYIVLRPQTHVDSNFLFYWLLNKPFQDQMQALQKGASYPAVTDTEVRNQLILIPSLPEQKRIVAILDEAFAGINQAIANTEKNLANARELFENYLLSLFKNYKENYQENKFKDVITIINGRNQKEVLSEKGTYPILGSAGNIMGYAINSLCRAGTTIIGRKGNISKPIFIDYAFWNVDTAFGLTPNNDYLEDKFFFYYCLQYDFLSMNKGTTIPSLVKSDLLEIPIYYPDLSIQKEEVEKINKLSNEIEFYRNSAEKKLQSLTELKQSLLQKAFTGELTANNVDKLVNP